jgi:hypothetical protein
MTPQLAGILPVRKMFLGSPTGKKLRATESPQLSPAEREPWRNLRKKSAAIVTAGWKPMLARSPHPPVSTTAGHA